VPLKNYFAQNTLSIQAIEVGTNTDFDLKCLLQTRIRLPLGNFDINYSACCLALLSGMS
jgi:hypothetical protein